MAERRIISLRTSNTKIMVCHSDNGFYSRTNFHPRSQRTVVQFNGYDLAGGGRKGKDMFRTLKLPEFGYFRIGDVFWGFVSIGVPHRQIPKQCFDIEPKKVSGHRVCDTIISRYLSYEFPPSLVGLSHWRAHLDRFLYATTELPRFPHFTPTQRALPDQTVKKPKTVTPATQMTQVNPNTNAPGSSDSNDSDGNEEPPTGPARPQDTTKPRYFPGIATAAKEPKDTPKFDWSRVRGPNPAFDDRQAIGDIIQRYRLGLNGRRAAVVPKRRKLDAFWEPMYGDDDSSSDDSIDSQLEINVSSGVRPRRGHRRDPDFVGSKNKALFMYELTSSDDDERRVLDPTGGARKRRRMERSFQVSTSRAFERNARILDTVLMAGWKPGASHTTGERQWVEPSDEQGERPENPEQPQQGMRKIGEEAVIIGMIPTKSTPSIGNLVGDVPTSQGEDRGELEKKRAEVEANKKAEAEAKRAERAKAAIKAATKRAKGAKNSSAGAAKAARAARASAAKTKDEQTKPNATEVVKATKAKARAAAAAEKAAEKAAQAAAKATEKGDEKAAKAAVKAAEAEAKVAAKAAAEAKTTAANAEGEMKPIAEAEKQRKVREKHEKEVQKQIADGIAKPDLTSEATWKRHRTSTHKYCPVCRKNLQHLGHAVRISTD